MRNFEKENPSLAKTQSQGPIQKKEDFCKWEIIGVIFFVLSIFCAIFFKTKFFLLTGVLSFVVAAVFGKGSTNATLGDSPSSSSFPHDPFERNHIPDMTSSSGDSYYDAPRSECWYTDSTNPLSPLNPTNSDD